MSNSPQYRKKSQANPIHTDLQMLLDYCKPNPSTGQLDSKMKIWVGKDGTARITIKCRTYIVARLIWMAVHQQWLPRHYEIRHKSYDLRDDRYSNLELVVHGERFKRRKKTSTSHNNTLVSFEKIFVDREGGSR